MPAVSVGCALRGGLRSVVVTLIRAYQIAISPLMGPACRYEPSCSTYAVVAIERYGVLRGSRLAVRRLFRCHPLGGFGMDPVP
jgi:putative membrane protein insertion efficiency factor